MSACVRANLRWQPYICNFVAMVECIYLVFSFHADQSQPKHFLQTYDERAFISLLILQTDTNDGNEVSNNNNEV